MSIRQNDSLSCEEKCAQRTCVEYKYPLPAFSKQEVAADWVIARLQKNGSIAYRVGGAVRDRLLGAFVQDVDVATDAQPGRVEALFRETYAVGADFGVIVVHTPHGVDVETATFRSESGYSDCRRPDAVSFSDPETDVKRRDFTVNALFYDPIRETIIDYAGGLEDLRYGVLRAVGDPERRFREDCLRMLRAVRFAVRLDFSVEEKTRAAIPVLAPLLKSLSAERVFSELTKMLTGWHPERAFAMLMELGLLDVWLPELVAMKGVEQPKQFHPEGDVWAHTLLLLEKLRGASPLLAWSALLHDVGKPETLEVVNDVPRFYGHDKAGEALCGRILKRLKAPGKLVRGVCAMTSRHMHFMAVQDMRKATLRRLMNEEFFNEELELHRLDCAASNGFTDNYIFLLDKIREFANEPVMPKPFLTGNDVLALGILPGPRVGRLLKQALEHQLEGDFSSREEALQWLAENQ